MQRIEAMSNKMDRAHDRLTQMERHADSMAEKVEDHSWHPIAKVGLMAILLLIAMSGRISPNLLGDILHAFQRF